MIYYLKRLRSGQEILVSSNIRTQGALIQMRGGLGVSS